MKILLIAIGIELILTFVLGGNNKDGNNDLSFLDNCF